MNSFNSKYPSVAALILIFANLAKDVSAQGETILQKLEASFGLLPQVISFIPQAGNLNSEITALKASPEDMVIGIEMLVNDLGFTSEKAKLIIESAFPLAEKIVSSLPDAKNLIAAIKA